MSTAAFATFGTLCGTYMENDPTKHSMSITCPGGGISGQFVIIQKIDPPNHYHGFSELYIYKQV